MDNRTILVWAATHGFRARSLTQAGSICYTVIA